MKKSEGIPFARPTNLLGERVATEKEELTMSTVTVRFRGICCFIDPTNGERQYFNKRVVLPNGSGHQHAGMEPHVSIIEFYADDLKKRAPKGMKRARYTRPGDDAQYACLVIDEPMWIELLGTTKGETENGVNLEDSVIHLDSLVKAPLQLKQTLLGRAVDVDSGLISAVVDLPQGTLMSGPPEAGLTKFPKSSNFPPRRLGRWLEHIAVVKENEDFGLKLTPLGKPDAPPLEIWFKSSTRLITIANEPLRLIVGKFVRKADGAIDGLAPVHKMGKHDAKKAKTSKNGKAAKDAHPGMQSTNGGSPQSTAHFNLYWELMADPPKSPPLPEPTQGTGPSCSPAIKP